MRPYTVLGAGAVGSALAAYLARRGHPVSVIGRADHVRAIHDQGGIRTISRTETFLAPVAAATELPEALPPDSVCLLTVQSPDVGPTVKSLAALPEPPITVTCQNGIRAEAVAAEALSRVYGGVVRFTATRLVPGEVRLRGPGRLVLGRYPQGVDEVSRSLADDLEAAGFSPAVSPDIQSDKLLKLLVNLVSGPPVLLKRTGKEPVLARVQLALLEEAREVLGAAGWSAHPASGVGESLEELIARFREGGTAPDTTGGIYNSTWQNLYHHRPRLENAFYHGEILALGKESGVPTPVNARALAVLEDVQRRGLGPEPYDLDTFRTRFQDVVDLDALPPLRDDSKQKDALEI